MLCLAAVAVLHASYLWAQAAPAPAAVDTAFARIVADPAKAGAVTEFSLKAVAGNCAGGDGLLQEGFGVPNPYVPNRRVNEQFEAVAGTGGAATFRYSYDCEGPNIQGLRVERTVEPMRNESSLRVRWKIQNQGDESQWVTPWVRNDVAPAGSAGVEDRIDVPTFTGVRAITQREYAPASRNWIAATDTVKRVSVCGVFNADRTHSFLTIRNKDQSACGFQTTFAPFVMAPGDVWETTYCLSVVRGLSRVDFASPELAAQVDYKPGSLQVLLSSVRAESDIYIVASVIADNGRVWKLEPKRFDIDPNRLVRCTYDWTAPAEGVYDFLAQLKRGGRTEISLNQDMAAPHGGIDTQFLVGAPPEVHMEPWTNAPLALDRGARTLKRPLAHRGDLVLWIEDSLTKLFPNDRVAATPGTPTARISLAGNERESFQIAFRRESDIDLADASVAVSALVHESSGAAIEPGDIRLHRVAFTPVRIPSLYEGPTGIWPDALPPLSPFKVAARTTAAVWVTVYARPGAAAGLYRGSLTFTAAGVEPIVVAIEARVFGFDLPRTASLQTDFGFLPARAVEACHALGCTLASADIAERYLTDALEHRVTLREAAQLPEPVVDYPATLNQFVPRLKKLLERGATSFNVPTEVLDDPAQLAQVNAFVEANGLKGRAFCVAADHPMSTEWADLVARLKTWRETAPSLRFMVSTFGLQPFLPYAAEIWDVHPQIFDTPNNPPLLERLGTGEKEVWWHVDAYPARPYGNFFADFESIEHRILFWQAWVMSITGFRYWAVNAPPGPGDPYASLLDATPGNGDGFLVYPGSNGPVPSIRWENIRDGLEDFEYLVLMREAVKRLENEENDPGLLERARAISNLKAIVPDLVSYPRIPSALQAKRDEIGAFLTKLPTTP